MKKILSLFLAVALLLSTLPAFAENAEISAAALPAVGDVVHGFEVLEIRDFPLIGSQVLLFEHQQTGAKLTYVANEDTNRIFQLTFRTKPYDNTGLPHVFEHATLSGSEKYPSSSLFMNLVYQTYNTYMNAYTMDAMTAYPVASLSEAQLLKYADYYTDSCLHPLILTDESIYRREAWRYRLENLEDPLSLEGTVYSEMLGAYTLERHALMEANHLTFPGATLGNDYGGVPDEIPQMTWVALKAYHELYYHPSNCMIYLYGQFEDYAAFLALLDEAFAGYEKQEIDLTEESYTPITESATLNITYPMAAGTDPANQNMVMYYLVCSGLRDSVEKEDMIDNLCSLLEQDGSPLMQALRQALPTGSFGVGREVAAPEDAIGFAGYNLNEGDAELFKATVDEALAAIAESGFSPELLDSAVSSLKISTLLIGESTSKVNSIVHSLAYHYAVTGDPFRYLDAVASLDHLAEWSQDGTYQALIREYLLENPRWTLTSCSPDVGGQDVHDALLEESLAAIKAGMTEAELQALVDATNAPDTEEDASAMVAALQAVTVSSLPEEIQTYSLLDETDDAGLRHIEATAGVDGIGKVSLYWDIGALPQEDIHTMRLFTRLLGTMDTDSHTREELDILISRYLYDDTLGISVAEKGLDDFQTHFVAEWTALDEDLATGYDLVEELVFHTQFTDTDRLLERVQAQIASVRSQINSDPYLVLLYRDFGTQIPFSRYYAYLNYLEYYDYLLETEALLQENPAEVTARLERVQAFLNNRVGAIATFAGNEESIALNRFLADAFFAKLDTVERERVSYDLPTASPWEALIIDGNVQFNNLIVPFSDLGLDVEHTASLEVISTLVEDMYLMPILRNQYGVYSPWCGTMSRMGLYLVTYRDPNVRETFDVYASLPELIATTEIDQDTLDGYILNVYSSLALGSGELSGASGAINDALKELDPQRKLTQMKDLKAMTPEAVQAAASIFQSAWDLGMKSTAGSAAAINANADLYTVILNPFGAKDASETEFTDAAEGSEHYEAVRFVFENALMAPLGEDTFGVEEAATVGDLSGALYVIVGGSPYAPEEALDFLSGYGIAPADAEVDTVLTNALSDLIFVNFGQAVQFPLEADTPEELLDVPVTRAELAETLMMLFGAEEE